MNRGGHPGDGPERAQSTVIGAVLLIGITVVGVTAVLWLGSVALQETRQQAGLDGMEQALVEFDSRASVVARGGAGTEQVRLPADGDPRVDPDAGWMNVSVVEPATGEVEAVVVNATLGTLVHRKGDATVAYQGGGVWKERGDASLMVSPPEIHYRLSDRGAPTLTLPLVTVDGEGPFADRVVLDRNGSPTAAYPVVGDGARSNPIAGGRIAIEVGSEYYRAWGRFFRDRTDSEVAYDHDAEVARIELDAPSRGFDAVVASTAPGGITADPPPPPEPNLMGARYPSADSLVDERVEECETDPGACDETLPNPLTAGTYYSDADLGGDLDVDASGGDVTIVVDGTFAPGSVDVAGDGDVTVYAAEGFAVAGNDAINAGGDAGAFAVVVGSEGDVELSGGFEFVGVVYAPGSDVTVNGGGPPSRVNVRGSVVGETVDVSGDPSRFEYDERASDVDLGPGEHAGSQTYLHVSVTRVNVTAG